MRDRCHLWGKRNPSAMGSEASPESPSQRPGDVNRERVDQDRVTAGREEGRVAVLGPHEAIFLLPMTGRNGRLETLGKMALLNTQVQKAIRYKLLDLGEPMNISKWE